ncbi:MAG: hypothetical protein RL328_548 [Acidobacteriota bacterium]
MNPLIAATLTFAWCATGTATATIYSSHHNPHTNTCQPTLPELVKFTALTLIWPCAWAGMFAEWLVARLLREDRRVVTARRLGVDVVPSGVWWVVDGDGDGRVVDESVRVFR